MADVSSGNGEEMTDLIDWTKPIELVEREYWGDDSIVWFSPARFVTILLAEARPMAVIVARHRGNGYEITYEANFAGVVDYPRRAYVRNITPDTIAEFANWPDDSGRDECLKPLYMGRSSHF